MTSIEWVRSKDGNQGETWNPLTGCVQVSEGCLNCYAKRLAKGRLKNQYPNGFGHLQLHEDRLDQPLRRRKPTTYFVCSMSDLFIHPLHQVQRVFNVMLKCPQHTFQILTKRTKNMAFMCCSELTLYGYGEIKNIWFGTTVEKNRHLNRIADLCKVPASVHFLSLEPLLEPIELVPWLASGYGIDWVIVGAESGPKARSMSEDWVRYIRDACIDYKVPFFYKQKVVAGKKISLPELDGEIWDQIPAVK